MHSVAAMALHLYHPTKFMSEGFLGRNILCLYFKLTDSNPEFNINRLANEGGTDVKEEGNGLAVEAGVEEAAKNNEW